MKNTLFILLLLSQTLLFSQQKFTVSGNVKDAQTGEDLPGVNILLKSNPSTGTTTNYYGYYSLSLPKGDYVLVYSYLGFESKEIEVKLDASKKINVELSASQENLKQVVIKGKVTKRNVRSVELGTHKISIKETQNLPVLLGERDIIKVIQLLPGVKPAGEGQAGFYVRGGNIDENLILLDQAPVYNASHLGGFFSVFNSDALRNVKLYKGFIPARFGSRLSSVMEVRMKEGNSKKFGGQGGLGLISSRLTLEGPIQKDKSSFIVSGRRTYADVVAKAVSNNPDIDKTIFYFYDLNMKTNYKFNDKNRLFLSGYFGRDRFGLNEDDASFSFSWGNATTTARFNHIFNNKLFSNTSLIFSDYNYKIAIDEKTVGNKAFSFSLGAKIQDLSLNNKFDYFLNDNNKLRFGFSIIRHRINPQVVKATGSGNDNEFSTLGTQDKFLLENALYVSNEQKIGKKLRLYYGLRYTNFINLGPGTFTKYAQNGSVISTKKYNKNEIVKIFHGIAPRLSLSFAPNNLHSFKLSFGKTYQFLHLMSNGSSSNPTDIWLPSGINIPAQTSYQGSLGYFKNIKDGLYEFSSEIYYKTMDNVVDYKTGTNISFNAEVEKDLVFGVGKAYGLELLLRKKQGKLTGWISYTLSRSLKKFDAINNGKWYSARQDRIHDISVVANYKITPRTELSGVWVFYTGNAVTFPAGFYQINGREYPYFTERNGGRMPNYHRMDISVTLYNKPGKKFRSNWNFSVYNIYAHSNPYFIYFEKEYGNNSYKLKAKQVTIFKWIPSITYNFKF